MFLFRWFPLLISFSASTVLEPRQVSFERVLWPRIGSRPDLIFETPTNETLANLFPFLANNFAQLSADDYHFQHFVPRFETSLTQLTPYGVFELSDIVGASYDQVTFLVAGFPRLLVRFMHDCVGGPLPISPHPLAKEFWFQQEAALANVTRQWLFLSPPAAIPIEPISPTLGFEMTAEEFAACHFSGGTVRYMIDQKTDEIPLSQVSFPPPGPLTLSRFKFAMMLGVHLMAALARLHARGIAHGSLSISSIHFQNDATIRSISINDYFFATTPEKPMQSFGHIVPSHAGSPWETNSSYSFKDDVFRAIQIVAAVINPREFSEEQERMNPDDLQAWKLGGNLFEVPGSADSRISRLALPESVIRAIRENLNAILVFARSADVQHRRIAENFRDCYILAFQTSRKRSLPT
jgi:hypothetical protein